MTIVYEIQKITLYTFNSYFSFTIVVPLESCKTSYRNYRKISKKKELKLKDALIRRLIVKIKKHPVPINTKYIIKTQRRTTYNF